MIWLDDDGENVSAPEPTDAGGLPPDLLAAYGATHN